MKKRILSIALVLCMCISLMPTTIFAAGENVGDVKDYEIFPIPHSITYLDGDYILRNSVNVTYESGIDDATKARLQEIAELKNLTLVEHAAVEGQTNLLVGITGNEDTTVDEYIESKKLSDADLFKKNDGYILSSQNDTIAILGKDIDSSFYGATTLYHIVKQMESKTIRNFVVKDYADVASRGFIEGYYGNPWSTQDRIHLMEWGGYYKLNSYIYAPKDDPKIGQDWREPYTPEEIETKINPLVEAGNNSKCRFVFALRFDSENYVRYDTDEHYQEDMNAMKTKFKQVIDAGVHQIAILSDIVTRSEDQKRTLEDITAWMQEMQKTSPDLKINLPYSATVFGESVSDMPDHYATLPENVQGMMYANRGKGDVCKDENISFTQKFNRAPYLWVNWPCSDNSRSHLVMGGYEMLHSDVEPGTVAGIVLNPMQQSEPSKVAIFGNACYSWNIWTDEERDMAYNASFKHVDHTSAIETPASIALRELSKHMQNHLFNHNPRHNESVELAPKIEAFSQALENGSLTTQQIDEMIHEFAILQDAAKTLRAKGNPQLLGDINKPYTDREANEQMAPWIDCWDDTTAAAIAYLNGIKDSLSQTIDFNKVMKYYNSGLKASNRADSHEFFYVNHMETAQVGRQHIAPFIKVLNHYLSDMIQKQINPEKLIKTYISDVLINPASGSLEHIFDGKDSTEVVFHEPLNIVKDNYFGVKYNRPIDITDIRVAMGSSSKNFAHPKLQYTQDGNTWQDINGEINDCLVDEVTRVITAKVTLNDVCGLRLVATEDNRVDNYICIKGFDVNTENNIIDTTPAYSGTVSLEGAVIPRGYSQNGLDNLMDGDKNTELWICDEGGGFVSDKAAAVVDLGDVKVIGSVCFVQGTSAPSDVIDHGVVEYSNDKVEWKTFGEINNRLEQTISSATPVNARYIRVRNTEQKFVWWRLAELSIYGPSADYKPDPYVYTSLDKTNFQVTMTSEDAEMSTGTVTLQPSDYFGMDLGEIRELSALTIPTDLNGTVFQISSNEVVWTDVIPAQADQNTDSLSTSQIAGHCVRYLRFINNTNAAITLHVDQFRIENAVIGKLGELVSSDIPDFSWGDTRKDGNAFDGDINTVTKFGGQPLKGNTIVYSLGREIDIHSIRIYNNDIEYDFIRDCKIQLSADGTNWKDALVIGDGVVDADRTTLFGDIDDPAKKSDPAYPMKHYYGNDQILEDVGKGACFLRVLFTADYPYRALVMNEIVLNGGHIPSVEPNKAFEGIKGITGHLPSNMLDKDINTTYKPNSENGHITYNLSDTKNITAVRIIQSSAINHDVVSAEVYKNNASKMVTLGTLSQIDNEFVVPDGTKLLSITITWTDKLPEIAEIMLMKYDAQLADMSELKTLTDDGYKPEGYDAWTNNAKNEYLAIKEDAKNVLASKFASKNTVDSMVATLRQAGHSNDHKIKANADAVKELQTLVDHKVSNEEHFYTTNSYASYETQVNKAVEVLKDPATLSKVTADQLIADIQAAHNHLEFSNYQREVTVLSVENFANIKKDDYSKKSYANLSSAKAAIDALLADQATQPADFAKAVATYNKAYKELYSVADLNALVAKELNKDLYTTTSFDAYNAAKKTAVDLLNSADTTNAQLDAAKNDLATAEQALEYKDADYSKVDQAIEQANQLVKEEYEDFSKVEAAIKDVVRGKNITQQAEVDAMATAINTEISKLVKIGIKPVQMNATLNNNIDMNIYLEITESVLKDENAYIQFTLDGQAKGEKLFLKDLKKQENGLYKATSSVFARQMQDDVTLEIYRTKSDGNVTLDQSYTYSVLNYAKKVLTNAETTEDEIALVKAMLDYGATAQVYFDYKTGQLVNAGLTEQAYKNVTVQEFKEYSPFIEGKEAIDGIRYGSANLRLLSDTAIRIHFDVTEDFIARYNAGEIKFEVTSYGETKELTPTFKNGKAYVEIENVFVEDLDRFYFVKVTDTKTNAKLSIDYSALSYGYDAMNSEKASANIKEVVKAMYVYNEKANVLQPR